MESKSNQPSKKSTVKKVFLSLTLLLSLLGHTSLWAQSKGGKSSVDYHQSAPTKFIDAGGTRYAYRILGNKPGIPLILFQHFTGHMDNWDPRVTNGFAKSYTVILFDNKGVGASSGETPDNINQMAKDAVTFIKALGYSKVNLLGFSMGGFIAQQIALDEPQLVNKMILAGTGQKGSTGLDGIVVPLTAASKMGPEEQKLYLFYSPSAYSQTLGKEVQQRIHSRKINRDTDATNNSIMAQLHAILDWAKPGADSLDRLTQTRQPVFIVNGNNDIVVPTINSYIMAQHMPNAQLSLYPDANHGSIFQYADLFVSQATDFLKRP